jgi:hypothetical protein
VEWVPLMAGPSPLDGLATAEWPQPACPGCGGKLLERDGAASILSVAAAVTACSNRCMDVRPIMPLPAAESVEQRAPIRVATPDSAPILAATMDSVAMLQLSPTDIGNLIRVLEPPAQPQQPSMSADLLGGAVSAAR